MAIRRFDFGEKTIWFELFSIFMSLSWGLILCAPGDTFETTKAYTLLRHWGETVWAILALSLSSLMIAGLLLGFLYFGGWFRLYGAVACAGFWGVLAYLLFQGNPIGHGWVIYASLAFANACVVVHHTRELVFIFKVGARA